MRTDVCSGERLAMSCAVVVGTCMDDFTRPILKHEPRSAACIQVLGWKTHQCNEREGIARCSTLNYTNNIPIFACPVELDGCLSVQVCMYYNCCTMILHVGQSGITDYSLAGRIILPASERSGHLPIFREYHVSCAVGDSA